MIYPTKYQDKTTTSFQFYKQILDYVLDLANKSDWGRLCSYDTHNLAMKRNDKM